MMISYNYNYPLSLANEEQISGWIKEVIALEGHELGELNYTFVSDDELYRMNVQYLNHPLLQLKEHYLSI